MDFNPLAFVQTQQFMDFQKQKEIIDDFVQLGLTFTRV
jgi:hypothetical protein